ncbi:site-2 protease family protein [Nocardiopsis quinghaiensis]|uniref:site-2 protease family protein n=1 Tax=Nocardiopsis quinghaiensis TaxID=464995 RepID=UPI001239CFD8|nr:site-2 protease family protein [Nocardiopsis quinghaiensis]
MPTPEPSQKAETTDVPEPERVGAPGPDPWEQMPEDALNRPDLGDASGTGTDGRDPVEPDGPPPADDVDGGPGEDSGRAPAGSWADFLPSPVFVLLLGLTGFAGWLSWRAVELDWAADDTNVTPLVPPLLILLGWIVSLAVHEFAHALTAYLAGDRSLRGSAYLRLNPFAYRQAFAGLVLPSAYLGLGAFGLTGPPTYVDWDRIPSRGRRVLVALAGPLASLLLAAALAAAVSVLVPPGNDTTNWAISAMAFLCFANLTAALVNLLPVPGLDGFEVLAAWTRGAWVPTARVNALFGSVAVFAVLWFPGLNDALVNQVYALFDLLLPNPVFAGVAFYGELLLRFWA